MITMPHMISMIIMYAFMHVYVVLSNTPPLPLPALVHYKVLDYSKFTTSGTYM